MKRALVISGGGSKGTFAVGVLNYRLVSSPNEMRLIKTIKNKL